MTAGLDLVSGDDSKTDELEGFSKYFGARHKHHGYYDYSSHKSISGTHMKDFRIKPQRKFNFCSSNLLVAMHSFSSHDGKKYGNELDLIIKRKVSDELSSEFGFVFYDPEVGNDLLTFMYVMFTANL